MEFKWVLTNIHEQKSYIVEDKTLIGQKNYCDIKLWSKNLNENDIRFKTESKRHICMKILRPDIKKFNIMINHKSINQNHIHIHNKDYISVDSYLFRSSRIQINEGILEQELLKNVTKTVIEKYKKSTQKKKTD